MQKEMGFIMSSFIRKKYIFYDQAVWAGSITNQHMYMDLCEHWDVALFFSNTVFTVCLLCIIWKVERE